jgi:molecular chaperone Hsp33
MGDDGGDNHDHGNGNGSDDEAQDEIVRGVLADLPVRVVAALTTGVAREAARRHQAGPAGAVALGRGLTAGLLLATLTKDDERVTLQVLGDGPLGGVTVDAHGSGTARAYVKHPAAGAIAAADPRNPRSSLAAAVGRAGVVSVIRDVGLRENFSGTTAIDSGEIDEDVERYLTESEQIESALACDATAADDGRVVASAGILVQALPGEAAIEVALARGLFADGALARVVAGGPPPSGDDLLRAVFAGRLGAIRVLDRRPARFFCPCSRERAGVSLAMLGDADLAAMILDDGKAEVTCNFCRARYNFDDAELERIRRRATGAGGPPS